VLAVLGVGGVCWSIARRSSGPAGRWRVIAAPPAAWQPVSGERGRCNNATATLPTASRSDRRNATATGRGGRLADTHEKLPPRAPRGSSPSVFFPATARAAMKSSSAPRGRPAKGFAPSPAAMPWSGFW